MHLLYIFAWTISPHCLASYGTIALFLGTGIPVIAGAIAHALFRQKAVHLTETQDGEVFCTVGRSHNSWCTADYGLVPRCPSWQHKPRSVQGSYPQVCLRGCVCLAARSKRFRICDATLDHSLSGLATAKYSLAAARRGVYSSPPTPLPTST